MLFGFYFMLFYLLFNCFCFLLNLLFLFHFFLLACFQLFRLLTLLFCLLFCLLLCLLFLFVIYFLLFILGCFFTLWTFLHFDLNFLVNILNFFSDSCDIESNIKIEILDLGNVNGAHHKFNNQIRIASNIVFLVLLFPIAQPFCCKFFHYLLANKYCNFDILVIVIETDNIFSSMMVLEMEQSLLQ